MSKIYQARKLLIGKVFEKGRETLKTDAKNSIADRIEMELDMNYNYKISAKTLVRCHDNLILGRKIDYKLKDNIAWDFLSKFVGYKNFEEFCEKECNNQITEKDNPVLEEISTTLTNIKDTLSTGLSYLMTGKNSFGMIGLIAVLGMFFYKSDFLNKKENLDSIKNEPIFIEKTNDEKARNLTTPQTVVYIPKEVNIVSERKIYAPRKKECMYWKNDHYEMVFCDEKISGTIIEAIDEGKLLMRKITFPDTLNVENALGKVWYDKSNHKVEFFTHYGIHPTNGKTLKPVTKYILETYVKE